MTSKENPLWKGIVSIWNKKSLRRLSSFPPFGVAKPAAKKGDAEPAHVSEPDSTADGANMTNEDAAVDHSELQPFFKPSWKNFSLAELLSATNNFSPGTLPSIDRLHTEINSSARFKLLWTSEHGSFSCRAESGRMILNILAGRKTWTLCCCCLTHCKMRTDS